MQAFALPPLPTTRHPQPGRHPPSSSSRTARPRPRMTVAPARVPASLPVEELSVAPAPAPPAPITEVDGVEEYLSLLQAAGDALVVLKVFAPWCRSCRALQPKVARLAREFGDVRFAKMDFERNRDLCYRLGVAAMPTFVFYKGPAGEIDKFSCGPLRAAVIREKIEQVLDGKCELKLDEEE